MAEKIKKFSNEIFNNSKMKDTFNRESKEEKHIIEYKENIFRKIINFIKKQMIYRKKE